jgi:hypothetical protein
MPLAFVFPHYYNGIVEGIGDSVGISDTDDVEVIGDLVGFKYFVVFLLEGGVKGGEGYWGHDFNLLFE